MKVVSGSAHRISGVTFVSATISVDPRSPDLSTANTIIAADMAYVRDDGLTCGKLSVHTPLCSEETVGLLAKFLESLERDAALVVFNLDETDVDDEDVDPL